MELMKDGPGDLALVTVGRLLMRAFHYVPSLACKGRRTLVQATPSPGELHNSSHCRTLISDLKPFF